MESEEFSAAEEGGRGDRKRRFSEEQIRSLESIFESQNKLEPRKKAQLARELGLQPRQVAIWFQNKRARWKSKQLEREYNTLRSDYEALLSSFESLKKEKQVLVKQLQKLAELLEKPAEQSSNDGDSDNGDNVKREEEIKPAKLLREGSGLKVMTYPEDEEKQLSYFTSDEQHNLLLYNTQPAARSLATAEQQCCLSCTCFPEQCCCSTNPQWWEFWPTSQDC